MPFIFNTCFNYDLKKGLSYFNKYRSIAKKNLENSKYNIMSDKNLHDSRSMSFLVKGDLNTLGEIVGCSQNVKKNLGYSKAALLGKNINILMPSFFQTVYTDLMKKKLKSNEQLFNSEHIDFFVKEQDGFITPIKNKLTIYPSLENGLLFWSLMRRVDSRFDYMLVSDNGTIEGISKRLGNELGINSNEKITINNICPSLSKIEKFVEIIFTGTLILEGGEDSQDKVTSYTVKNDRSAVEGDSSKLGCSEKIMSIIDEEAVLMAQAVLQDVTILCFKPRSNGAINTTINYICKCSIQSHQSKVIKIYTLQKVSVQIGLNFQVTQPTEDKIQVKNSAQCIRRKASSEYDFSLDEFDNRNCGNNYHVQPTENLNSKIKDGEAINRNLAEIASSKNINLAKSNVVQELNQQFAVSSLDENDGISHTITIDVQSSLRSDVSDSRRRGEKLENLLKFLKFYRFSGLKAPFFLIIVYLIILLIIIWLICYEATISIPLIKGTVEVFTIMLERYNILYSVMRNNYLIFVLPILYIDASKYSLGLASDLIKLATENTKLSEKIDNLEKETKDLFYYDNVKIYYGGFSAIKNSTDYQVLDAIGSVNSIIAEGLYRSSHPNPTTNRSKYSEDFLYINLYNDYLIKNEELQGKISVDLNVKASNIAERCDLYIMITSVFLGIAVIAFR